MPRRFSTKRSRTADARPIAGKVLFKGHHGLHGRRRRCGRRCSNHEGGPDGQARQPRRVTRAAWESAMEFATAWNACRQVRPRAAPNQAGGNFDRGERRERWRHRGEHAAANALRTAAPIGVIGLRIAGTRIGACRVMARHAGVGRDIRRSLGRSRAVRMHGCQARVDHQGQPEQATQDDRSECRHGRSILPESISP